MSKPIKNRNDLLEAMLQEWETYKTDSIIERVESEDCNPRDKLLSLFEIAAQDDDRLERAVRIWAMNDTKAFTAIARVDQRRLDYLQNLFVQLGFSSADGCVAKTSGSLVEVAFVLTLFNHRHPIHEPLFPPSSGDHTTVY